MTGGVIEWTGKRRWNPLCGCTRKTEACLHCYAEGMAARFSDIGMAFEGFANWVTNANGKREARWTGKVELIEDRLTLPLTWKKRALCFTDTQSDFFHESLLDEVLDRRMAVMALCPQHHFQVLTKRWDRMRQYVNAFWADEDAAIARMTAAVNDVFRLAGFRGNWGRCGSTSTYVTTATRNGATGAREYGMLRRCPDGGVERFYFSPLGEPERWFRCSDAYAERVQAWGAHTSEFGWGPKEWPLPNVSLGVSVHDQASANEAIPALLNTPAAIHFVSYEPALQPIHWGPEWLNPPAFLFDKGLDLIIAGEESGPGRREVDIDVLRQTRDQCAAAGTHFFLKQRHINGKLVSCPELDGHQHTDLPKAWRALL